MRNAPVNSASAIEAPHNSGTHVLVNDSNLGMNTESIRKAGNKSIKQLGSPQGIVTDIAPWRTLLPIPIATDIA